MKEFAAPLMVGDRRRNFLFNYDHRCTLVHYEDKDSEEKIEKRQGAGERGGSSAPVFR